MSLFIEREDLQTIVYPQFYDAWEKIVDQPWSFNEVPMEGDISQWSSELTEADRDLILSILKGFTKVEAHVGCYWSDVVAKNFKAQEVVNFARAASFQETVHLRAYAHLESTLGVNTTKAFLQDIVATAKIDYIFENIDENPENLARSLAVFSGAVEGVSLFASFVILLSFARDGLLLGLKQIISWSVLDEHLHSETGIQIFKELIKEKPNLRPSEAELHKAFRKVVENEVQFIKKAFSGYSSSRITESAAVEYVKYRANDRLLKLGYRPIYRLNNKLVNEIKTWFDKMVWGVSHNDFFAASKNGQAYQAILSQDFASVDTSKFVKPERLLDKLAKAA